MRTTPYLRMPRSRSFFPMRAGLPHLRQEVLPFLFVPHGRAAAGRRPHRRDERADDEMLRADLVGEPFQIVVGRVDADVRVEEKQIDAVELDAVHFGRRRHVEHRVEVDRRLGIRALADQPGPHGVMDSGVFVLGHGHGPPERRTERRTKKRERRTKNEERDEEPRTKNQERRLTSSSTPQRPHFPARSASGSPADPCRCDSRCARRCPPRPR